MEVESFSSYPDIASKSKAESSTFFVIGPAWSSEDAICATKAAIKEGIVPGGGIALLNAAQQVLVDSESEKILLEAIKAPFKTILANAGIEDYNLPTTTGEGLNVVTGNMVNMIDNGIIDPLLVTKSALKNAASVATTILSTDCVINNLRVNEGNRE